MRLLHENATEASLAFARVYVYGIWFVKIGLEPTYLLRYMPEQVYEPIGVLRVLPEPVFDALTRPESLHGLKIGLLVLLLMVIVNVCRAPAQIAACALLVFHQGLVRGFTRVNHAEMALLYVTLILAACDIGQRAIRRRGMQGGGAYNSSAITLQTCALAFCLTYCFAGAHRLVRSGGMEFITSYTTTYWMVRGAFMPNDYQFGFGRMLLEYPQGNVLLNLGFATATGLEILAPFCLVMTTFRRVWIAAMLGMHVGIMLTMKFLFWENCLLMVLLINYHGWLSRWSLWLGKWGARWRPCGAGVTTSAPAKGWEVHEAA